MTTKLLAVVTAALVLSCSGSGSMTGAGGGAAGGGGGAGAGAGGTGGGAAGSVALDAYCNDYASALCTLAIRCGQLEASGCARYKTLFAGGDCLGQQQRRFVDAGVILYDAAKAKDCFDQVAAGACTSRSKQVLAACRGTFVGTKAIGQPCYENECVPAAWCGSSLSTCPGTCKADVDAGAVPPKPDACPEGTFTVGNSECAPLAAIGSDCSSATSFFGKPCVLGSYCSIRTDAGTSVCSSGSALGGPCRLPVLGQMQPCKIGLSCSDPDGGVCTTLRGQGGACSEDGDCAVPLFCKGGDLFAGLRGTCQPRVGLDAGCVQQGECDDGLVCATMRCAMPAKPGQVCTSAAGCTSGYSCGTDAGCAPLYCFAP